RHGPKVRVFQDLLRARALGLGSRTRWYHSSGPAAALGSGQAGKAPDSGSGDHRFESYLPSQHPTDHATIGRMPRVKVSVTVDPHLLNAVDSFVREHDDLDRSKVIEQA